MFNYNGFATGLFGGLVDKYSSTLNFVKNYLPKADIKVPFRTYMCVALLTSSIIFFLSIGALFIAFNFIEIQAFNKIILFILAPFILAATCFAIFSFYPTQKANSRRKSIDTNLPFVLTHMGTIAESGIPPYVIFKLLADFEEYGEIANEMKKLVRNVDSFGMDPLTAIKEIAERTPSKEFGKALLGIVTTTESGGDVKTYLKNSGEQALFNWKIKREKFLQQLSAYAEFYTGILIAAPLFIIALFSVMGMISPTLAGYDILTLTKLSIYLLVPAVNIGFLIFLKGVEVEM
jgi:flagellar protein FlaJ